MTKHNIEDLPQAVKSKILTKQEAARIIWEEVYTKPYRYGLKRFTADQKSDILIELLPNFEKLFDKFIPEGSSFSTYVTGCIKNYRNRFLGSQLTAELE